MKANLLILATVLTCQSIQANAQDKNVQDKKVKEILSSIAVAQPASIEDFAASKEKPDDSDLLGMRRNTLRKIEDVLTQKSKMTSGAQLDYLINSANQIIADDRQRPLETSVRDTLGWAVDAVNGTIAVAGRNSNALAIMYDNFMVSAFQLSAYYIKASRCLSTSNIDEIGVVRPSRCSEVFPKFQVAANMAQLLWRTRASLISNSAKSILVIKMIEVLKNGINESRTRDEVALAEIYQDLIEIETRNVAYANVVASLGNGIEPETNDVNSMNGAVYKVYIRLPKLFGR